MKQKSRPPKSYPDWRQREARMLRWALAVGIVAAAATGLVIWLANRNSGH